MTSNQLRTRKKRAEKLNVLLRQLYPTTRIALRYTTEWELLVAVQLSAQCTDARVNIVTATLFNTYRTVKEYADASQEEMEQLVFQCGFYRNKAKNIRSAARIILDEFNGKVPRSMEDLLRIPGVARKTANVVLSSLFGVHEGIAVDTHVRRFAIRFDLTSYRDPVRIERDLMAILPKSEWWGFNYRLIQYGRDVCRARTHACSTHLLTYVYPKAAMVWPKAKG